MEVRLTNVNFWDVDVWGETIAGNGVARDDKVGYESAVESIDVAHSTWRSVGAARTVTELQIGSSIHATESGASSISHDFDDVAHERNGFFDHIKKQVTVPFFR